jgi:hypothetical protein
MDYEAKVFSGGFSTDYWPSSCMQAFVMKHPAARQIVKRVTRYQVASNPTGLSGLPEPAMGQDVSNPATLCNPEFAARSATRTGKEW